MAMLRVYKENGGKVTADHIRVSRSKEDRTKDFRSLKNGFFVYNQYAEKQSKTIFSGSHDWSIFEQKHVLSGLTDGRTTGTKTLLNTYSRICSQFIS